MIALALTLAVQEPPRTVYGPATESCGTWVSHISPEDLERLADVSWLNGFLSGYNVWSPEPGTATSATDMRGMVAWIDNYCRAHPLETVGTAATVLVYTLRERAGLRPY